MLSLSYYLILQVLEVDLSSESTVSGFGGNLWTLMTLYSALGRTTDDSL